jgi:hypothetical protein
MLDDAFFAYHEDIDLAIRGSRAGFRSALVGEASVYHKKDPAEPTPPHAHYYFARNEFFIWRGRAPLRARLRAALWRFNTLLNQIDACRGRPEHRQAMLAGYWHGLTGRTGMYRPEHRMPWPLRQLILSCPALVRGVLRLG